MGSAEQLTRGVVQPKRLPPHARGAEALRAWVSLLLVLIARTALSVVLALLVWSVLPTAFGLTSTTVMSDSMAPRLQIGDIVVSRPVHPSEVRIGTVVLVDDPDFPGRLRLHRLVGIEHGELVLKGDANATDDSTPVSPVHLRAAAFLKVPAAGLPLVWWRTGNVVPLVGLGLLIVVIAAVASSSRGGRHRLRTEPHVLKVARQFARVAPLGVPLLVIAVVITSSATPSAWAAFKRTTANTGDRFAAASAFACAARIPSSSIPTPWLAYTYPYSSASTTPDRSGAGRVGTKMSGVTNMLNTCGTNASDYIAVDGTATGYLAAQTTTTSPAAFSLATWFRTTSARGKLIGFGSDWSRPSASQYYDRHLYIDSSGKLVFGVRTSGTSRTCASSTAVTDGAWHQVVATYADGAGMKLYLDGATTPISCNPDPTGLIGSYSGYWRIGYDTLSAAAPDSWTGASADDGAALGGAFKGDLDETGVWTSQLTATQAAAIYAFGH